MTNDNEPSSVIRRDVSLRHVPCIWCKRSKASHPHLEFFGNEEGMICTEHAEAAMRAINNAGRLTLQQWMDDMRRVYEVRVKDEY